MITRTIYLLLITILSFGSVQKSTAQIIDLKHSVYAELAGSAGLWSVNYDLMVLNISNFKVGARLGFGFMTEGYTGTSIDMHIPITVNVMYAFFKQHHVEFGIGTQIASYEIRSVKTAIDAGFERKTESLGNMTLGYRFQNPKGGFMFRVFYSPFFHQDGNYFRYENWGGISLGYAFGKGKKGASKTPKK